MTDFKKGDVVMLKSGGPKMTIKYLISDEDSCLCQWFDVNLHIQAVKISLSSIVKVSKC